MTPADPTPAPWRVSEANGYHGVNVVAASSGLVVANVVSYGVRRGVSIPEGGDEECVANARLIAAAPDLLRLVREVIDSGCLSGNTPEWYEAALRAVERVEGGE